MNHLISHEYWGSLFCLKDVKMGYMSVFNYKAVIGWIEFILLYTGTLGHIKLGHTADYCCKIFMSVLSLG